MIYFLNLKLIVVKYHYYLKTTTGVYLIVPSMADVDQNCDFLLRIFSQDTTIGRTFVNIFANDTYEDLSRRNLNQQHTKSEQRPCKLKNINFISQNKRLCFFLL